jgi:hypothetical protein
MAASAAADTGRGAPERAGAACEPFLPFVVFPRQRGGALESFAPELHSIISRYLPRAGALLFRGFPVSEDRDFERFVALVGETRCYYEEPRRVSPHVEEGPSAECPIGTNWGHEVLAAALEPSSPLAPPAQVWAWCALPGRGQRLLLADRRELHRAVPADVRRRWAERGLAYVLRDEHLRPLLTRCLAPVAVHPLTREAVWAQPEHAARAGGFGGLRGIASGSGEGSARRGGDATHWTVTHGDGAPLAEQDVHDVNDAVDACRTELCLEARDVLLLDPALMAHATTPGAGAGIDVRRR